MIGSRFFHISRFRVKKWPSWLEMGTVGGLFVVSYIVGCLIVAGRLRYIIAIFFLNLFFYLVWVKRRFEVGLVLFLIVTFFWEYGLRGGWWAFGNLYVGHGVVVLLGVIGVYYIQLLRNRPISPAASQSGRSFKIKWLVAFYLVSLLLSSLSLDNRWQALNDWILYGLKGLLLFIFLPKVLREERAVNVFLSLLLLLGVFLSFADNWMLLTGKQFFPYSLGYIYEELTLRRWISKAGLRIMHVPSVFGDASFGGAFMISMIPISLSLLIAERKLLLKCFYTVVCFSMMINIVAYGDRGSWVGLFASSVVMSVFVGKKRLVSIGLPVLAFLLMASVGYISGAGTTAGFTEFIQTFTGTERIALWQNTLAALPHFPLLGTGFRNMDEFVSIVSSFGRESYSYSVASWRGEWVQPHNSYLELWISAGVPAFVFFTALVIFVGWCAVRAIRNAGQEASFRLKLVGMFAGIVAFLTEAMFDRTLFIPTLNAFFWIYMGTVYALTVCPNQPSYHRSVALAGNTTNQ